MQYATWPPSGSLLEGTSSRQPLRESAACSRQPLRRRPVQSGPAQPSGLGQDTTILQNLLIRTHPIMDTTKWGRLFPGGGRVFLSRIPGINGPAAYEIQGSQPTTISHTPKYLPSGADSASNPTPASPAPGASQRLIPPQRAAISDSRTCNLQLRSDYRRAPGSHANH